MMMYVCQTGPADTVSLAPRLGHSSVLVFEKFELILPIGSQKLDFLNI